MGCVRRCARFHIGRGQFHDRREHRGGGWGKIGHVAWTVLITLGGWQVTDRRKRDEAFAGRELDWLAGRQRRRGIAARFRRKRGREFRSHFGQQSLIVPWRTGLALAGSGVRATRQNRQLGAGGCRTSCRIPARDRRPSGWTGTKKKAREDRSWQFAFATAWVSGPERRQSGQSYRVSPCPAGGSPLRPGSPPRALRPC